MLKIEIATAQLLLLSIVATNYFPLLGLGRIYNYKRQQTFSNAIDPQYALALLFGLVMTVLPTALDDGVSATAELDHAMAPSSATLL